MADEVWLRRARELDFGRSTKIECCAHDRSMSLTHNAKGYVAYCFRCHRTEFFPHGTLSIEALEKRQAAIRELSNTSAVSLPQDFSTEIPDTEAVWLLRAGIPLALAKHYGFGYSASMRRVVLPVYRDKELIAYSARSTVGDKPKYLARQKDGSAVFISDEATISAADAQTDFGTSLCVTEDILSAVRVGRILRSVALLGTASSDAKVAQIFHVAESTEQPRITLWLDPDTAGKAGMRTLERTLRMQGARVQRVHSERDPKLYSSREIRKLLLQND